MTSRRHCQSVLLSAVLSATIAAGSLSAQDSFAQAKQFYEQAAYDEALVVLDKLNGSSEATTETAAYRVFCLVALGRKAEATNAIAAIVAADPLYRPSEDQASPRIRTFFEDARRPLLPDVVRQTYARAKAAFDQKEMKTAATEFDRAISLLDEVTGKEGDGISDLRTLAVSFRDLARLSPAAPTAPVSAPEVPAPAAAGHASVTRAAAAPTPSPTGTPSAAAAPSPAGAPSPAAAESPVAVEVMGPVTATSSSTSAGGLSTPYIYGASDTGVQKPVAVTRPLPTWQPRSPVEARQGFHGILEVVVDEQGRVTHSSLLRPVHPTYDDVLLKAIQQWKFRPAMKDGVPVKYRYTADITLGPSRR